MKRFISILALIGLVGCYTGPMPPPESPYNVQEEFGCTEPIPSYESHQKRAQDFPEPSETATLLRVFGDKWVEYFGRDEEAIYNTLNKLCIIWNDGPIYIEGEEDLFDGYTTTDRTWVNILDPEYRKVYNTALTHEMVHNALYYHNGNPDGDHTGRENYGWSTLHDEMIHDIMDTVRSMYESRQRQISKSR